MNEELLKLIELSKDAHAILPYDETETTDYRLEKKPVLESVVLDECESLEHWKAVTEYAKVTLSGKESYDGHHSVLFTAPTKLDGFIPGRAPGRIYIEPKAMRRIDHQDLRHYNRLSVWVKPDVPGFRSIVARLQLYNEGTHRVPDKFEREGHHNVSLKNGVWNHITCEIDQLDRDDVTGIALEYDMCGHEFDAAGEIKWYIDRLELQVVEPEMYKGWVPGKGRIAFSGSGYLPEDEKLAVMNPSSAGEYFKVLETQSGRVVLRKKVLRQGDTAVLDFSEIKDFGRYLILCGEVTSRVFAIGPDVWQPSVWKVLNFYLSQRCGYEVPGKHHACHCDLLLKHGDKAIVANGGWHDAADLAQGMGNTCNGTIALFLLAGRLKGQGGLKERLQERVLEEARWGLSYVLKTRFGDGYRSSYSSVSIWTDGVIGTDDDQIPNEPSTDPHANFTAACAEALGAQALRDSDPAYADYCLKISKEDFGFALDAWEKEQKESGDSGAQFYRSMNEPVKIYALAAAAAAEIYAAGEKGYLAVAAEHARKLIACQQAEKPDWDTPIRGFFWTDEQKRIPVHHAHHSFEQYLTMGLSRLYALCPGHADAAKWHNALSLYCEYLKTTAAYTAPWAMLPEGIYHEDEAKNYPLETRRGIIACDDKCLTQHADMVRCGIPLGKGYYLRRFPVWFSFRGNLNVLLSQASALGQAANAVGDKEALALMRKQLEWTVGKNPFAQSLIFGEGYDWTNEYVVQPGQTVGQMPVGIESYFNEDVPYWPQICTATYKEVWIEPANKWMWALSQLI
ncbi:MAG: glycoside hydrolase family 9 protein [Clostridia bacterium]|nr:glycoside hydrolase family 9 protein [Clostridia bacterium]